MTATTLNPVVLSSLVDRLAMIKAQCADLKKEEDQIKAQLIDADLPVIESAAYRASVAHCAGRVTIDWQTIAKRFNPSHQLVTAHTSQGEAYAVIRVSARKGN